MDTVALHTSDTSRFRAACGKEWSDLGRKTVCLYVTSQKPVNSTAEKFFAGLWYSSCNAVVIIPLASFFIIIIIFWYVLRTIAPGMACNLTAPD